MDKLKDYFSRLNTSRRGGARDGGRGSGHSLAGVVAANGVIHDCPKKNNGQLRVIDSAVELRCA